MGTPFTRYMCVSEWVNERTLDEMTIDRYTHSSSPPIFVYFQYIVVPHQTIALLVFSTMGQFRIQKVHQYTILIFNHFIKLSIQYLLLQLKAIDFTTYFIEIKICIIFNLNIGHGATKGIRMRRGSIICKRDFPICVSDMTTIEKQYVYTHSCQ